jgi:hypothetical protein
MAQWVVPPMVVPGHAVESVLFSTDYHRAEGLIDVLEHGTVVRSCRFVHTPATSALWVHCSVDRTTYIGDGKHGHVEHPDGRRFPAPGATAIRDIPNWLLCPRTAPIWGRPGEDWDADTSRAMPVTDGAVTLVLAATSRRQRSGSAEVAWPEGYLRQLDLGDEQYLLRELTWRPTHGPAHPYRLT